MRLPLVISFLLCGVLSLPAAPASASLKKDRYVAWFEASVTEDRRTSGFTTQANCSGVYTLHWTRSLRLRSTQPSVLVATRLGKSPISFGGNIQSIAGSFREDFAANIPCPPSLPPGAVPLRFAAQPTSLVPSSPLVTLAPLELVDGSLAVKADPHTPVAFSAFRYSSARNPAIPITRDCCDGVTTGLAAELANAAGSLTPAQLSEAKVDDVVLTGSFTGDVPWGLPGTRSLTITWRLTFRAIFDRNAIRVE